MRLIDNMADKIRSGMRSFLRITPAQNNSFQITETLDFNANAAKNRIWYRGDADEIMQLYKESPGSSNRFRFWAAVPIVGREIEKIHTGLPGTIIEILTSVVVADINGIKVDGKYQSIWDEIEKDNNFMDLLSEALPEVLVVGDGAFRICFDDKISEYPIIEFVPGDFIDFHYERGRIREIEFKTVYQYKYNEYILHEIYGYGYLNSILTKGDTEVPLTSIPDTEEIIPAIVFDKSFMLAVPFKVLKSKRYKNRGGSIFDGKTDNFDALDESWSQWMDALRKARTKEYIPESLLPRNPNTGEVIKPSAFDNAYIQQDDSMQEGVAQQVQVVQPDIPHESYLSTYVTALDLCLQGIISPSTLGIDVKKLDNADAQREKEKATLYTRNKIVEAMQSAIPQLVDVAIKAYNTRNTKAIEDVKAEIPFGEYANPSFESQVETVSKARTGQIMSIEAAVEELYGDTKEDKWKQDEVARLKAEQGIVEAGEPSLNTEGVVVDESKSGEKAIPDVTKGVPGAAQSS